jgi:hypothetical protein
VKRIVNVAIVWIKGLKIDKRLNRKLDLLAFLKMLLGKIKMDSQIYSQNCYTKKKDRPGCPKQTWNHFVWCLISILVAARTWQRYLRQKIFKRTFSFKESKYQTLNFAYRLVCNE